MERFKSLIIQRAAGPLRSFDYLLGYWIVPAGIRVGSMLVQFLMVALLAKPSIEVTWSRFSIWDARFYALIAGQGYPSHVELVGGNLLDGSIVAFHPLFPGVSWVVDRLLRIGVVPSTLVVASVCSVLLGPATAHLVAALGASRRAGYVATLLLGALPMAVVFQMAYAESMFVLLSMTALLSAKRQRWLVCTVLLVLAGLTRPVAIVPVAGVLALGLTDWVQSTDRTRRQLASLIASCCAGLAAGIAYWLAIGAYTSQLTIWFDVQRAGWGTRLDFGREFVRFFGRLVVDPDSAQWPAIAVLLAVIGYSLVSLSAATRVRTLAFGVMGFVAITSVVVSTNYWHSKPRLLLACAALVVPVGIWLARQGWRASLPILTITLFASWWFGAYMITQWPYAI